jgi:RNA polymerase sigma-70 factor (ECF subfamily)
VEEDLIRKAIGRDRSAIETLYDSHAPALLSVCFRYCGNHDDAEDILHDGFIKIIQKIHTFRIRSEGSFEAWMRRIMVNTALNFLRSKQKEGNAVYLDHIQDNIDFHEDDEDSVMETYPAISREKIMQLICDLPVGYRTVFNLYVFEQYAHREIAEFLGCTENTSRSQLSKARALLRKNIEHSVKSIKSTTYEKV